jgi:hypothetical protein
LPIQSQVINVATSILFGVQPLAPSDDRDPVMPSDQALAAFRPPEIIGNMGATQIKSVARLESAVNFLMHDASNVSHT